MKRGFSAALFLLAGFFFFASCETPPESIEKDAEPVSASETKREETEPEPVAETVEVPEEPASDEDAEEVFSVSEEVFTETFEDIRQLIEDLNSIVREENYNRWLKYLTDEYIAHFSSRAVLVENSNQPILKKYNISLSSLEDYFKWVVVPSRSNARLDDIVFIDNEHVKAIMIFNDQRTILYLLEKDGNGWKIGL